MTSLIVREGRIFQGENARFLERAEKLDGTLVVAADVTNWDLKVFNITAPSAGPPAAIFTLSAQSPTGVVQTSLQTDSGWSKDDIGYNFKYTLVGVTPTGFLQKGGSVYRFEFKLNTASFGAIFLMWDLYVDPVLS
jgi:hypothetical protein